MQEGDQWLYPSCRKWSCLCGLFVVRVYRTEVGERGIGGREIEIEIGEGNDG